MVLAATILFAAWGTTRSTASGTPRVAPAVVLVFATVVIAAPFLRRREHWLLGAYLLAVPFLPDANAIGSVSYGSLGAIVFLVWATAISLTSSRTLGTSRRLFWLFIALAALSIASLLWTGSPTVADFGSTVLKCVYFAVLLWAVHAFSDTADRARALLGVMLMSAALVSSYVVASHVLGLDSSSADGFTRARGTFNHWNQLGGYLVLLIVPLALFALTQTRGALRALLLTGAGIGVVALLFTATLGSYVGLAVSVVLALRKISGGSRAWATVVMCSLALVVGVVVTKTPVVSGKITLTGSRAEDRFGTYQSGLRLIMARPILGWGSDERVLEAIQADPDRFGGTSFGGTQSVPHNAFLSVTAALGVIGLVLLVWIFAESFRMVRRGRQLVSPPTALALSGVEYGMIGFLVQNLTNNLALHLRIGAIFVAIVVAASRWAEEEVASRARAAPERRGR